MFIGHDTLLRQQLMRLPRPGLAMPGLARPDQAWPHHGGRVNWPCSQVKIPTSIVNSCCGHWLQNWPQPVDDHPPFGACTEGWYTCICTPILVIGEVVRSPNNFVSVCRTWGRGELVAALGNEKRQTLAKAAEKLLRSAGGIAGALYIMETVLCTINRWSREGESRGYS